MQQLYKIINQQSDLDFEQIRAKVDACIAIIRSIPITHQYHYKSPYLIDFYQNFKLDDYGPFHKIVLLKLIDSFKIAEISLNLPQSMQQLYKSEFDRIKDLIKDVDFIFDWQNDLFAKDIGICSGRLLPIGPGLLEVSGVPRILIFRKGLGQFLKLIQLLLFKLSGHKPILENHTHLANVTKFNEQGWKEAYAVVAEILRLNPELIGFMRSSWFIDPIISKISPKLSYLKDVPVLNGAEIFYNSEEGRKSGAFSRSKSRLALFDKKEYTPKTYYLIWPRDKLIQYIDSR